MRGKYTTAEAKQEIVAKIVQPAASSARCSIATTPPANVWADTAYRSAANLALLDRRGLTAIPVQEAARQEDSGAHRPAATPPARVRSRVEHVFAAQKCRLVRTVGMVRTL